MALKRTSAASPRNEANASSMPKTKAVVERKSFHGSKTESTVSQHYSSKQLHPITNHSQQAPLRYTITTPTTAPQIMTKSAHTAANQRQDEVSCRQPHVPNENIVPTTTTQMKRSVPVPQRHLPVKKRFIVSTQFVKTSNGTTTRAAATTRPTRTLSSRYWLPIIGQRFYGFCIDHRPDLLPTLMETIKKFRSQWIHSMASAPEQRNAHTTLFLKTLCVLWGPALVRKIYKFVALHPRSLTSRKNQIRSNDERRRRGFLQNLYESSSEVFRSQPRSATPQNTPLVDLTVDETDEELKCNDSEGGGKASMATAVSNKYPLCPPLMLKLKCKEQKNSQRSPVEELNRKQATRGYEDPNPLQLAIAYGYFLGQQQTYHGEKPSQRLLELCTQHLVHAGPQMRQNLWHNLVVLDRSKKDKTQPQQQQQH